MEKKTQQKSNTLRAIENSFKEIKNKRGQEETFRCDRYFYDIDCGDSFSTHIPKLTALYTSNMYNFLCQSYVNKGVLKINK